MTQRTKVVGYQTASPSSDQYLAPQKAYTGDGKTTRQFIDGKPRVEFKKATDK